MASKNIHISFSKFGVGRLLARPEILIALLALFFGLVFIVIIKPLQIPDEPNHFIRAYQISEGGIFQQIDMNGNCIGESGARTENRRVLYSELPQSITGYADGNRDAYSVGQLINEPLNSSDRVNVCARQTAANNPVGYAPQAAAITILRIFGASPVLLNYAARVAILVTWVMFVYFAVRIIPVRKWTLGFIALMPMAVQQSMAIGADVLSIAPAMLLVAIIVRSYYEHKKNNIKRDLVTIAILVTIAALSKPVMLVLILLLPFYRILQSKLWSNKRIVIAKTYAILVPVITWLIWSILASHHQLSVTDVFPLAAERAEVIKAGPIEGLGAFMLSAIRYIFYDLSLWGFGSFSWFTTHLPQALTYMGLASLAMVLSVGYDEKNRPTNKVKKKDIYKLNSVLGLTALGIVGGNIFTLYMIYTPLEAWKVEGMQFRYFIPALIVLAAMIEIRLLRSSERFYRNFVLISVCLFFLVSVAAITRVLPNM